MTPFAQDEEARLLHDEHLLLQAVVDLALRCGASSRLERGRLDAVLAAPPLLHVVRLPDAVPVVPRPRRPLDAR